MAEATADVRIAPDAARRQPPAVIGPNAVIQLGAALCAVLGKETAQRVYDTAGCAALLDAPPHEMIDERVPASLFRQLWRELPPETARAVALDAGRRTGRYILQNRIPRFAHVALRMLPRSIASRLLLSAIEKNAWTFAGSGTCRTVAGTPAMIEIARNPLQMPGGVWHEAVFAELFGALLRGKIDVRYAPLWAGSTAVCRFEICFDAVKNC